MEHSDKSENAPKNDFFAGEVVLILEKSQCAYLWNAKTIPNSPLHPYLSHD